MIDKIREAAQWLGDLAEKAKAVAAAVSTFAGVVVVATQDDRLSLDEWPTLVTAGITLATVVYAIVWRVPNQGFVKSSSFKGTDPPAR